MKRKKWRLEKVEDWSAEGYWASYSDLMAGILLVFAVAAASSWIEFNRRMVEPTEPLKKWESFLESLCNDKTLQMPGTEVDCKTGSLVLTEDSLRYAKGDTDLSEAGKQLLKLRVPQFLEAFQKRANDVPLIGIEISGHTDSTGKFDKKNNYVVNLNVARERAAKVLQFLASEVTIPNDPDLIRNKGFSASYADSRPPRTTTTPDPEGNWPAARRIEIQLHVDKDKILEGIKQVLDSIKKDERR